jgi:hypothetical protein
MDWITLASFEAEDYLNFFKSEDSERLKKYIDFCLIQGKIAGADENRKMVTAKATQALKLIAKEDRLNQLRVKTLYGINTDAEESAKKPDLPKNTVH